MEVFSLANKCIACDVTSCKHHAGHVKYCTLDNIKVTHHSVSEATSRGSTDCGSFEFNGCCSETN